MIWPAAARPYIGGSQNNSILELMLGYNGLGRLTGDETGSVGGGGGPCSGARPASSGCSTARSAARSAWLLPAALIALVAGLWSRGARRAPTRPGRAGRCGAAGCVVTALVFSLMAGHLPPVLHGCPGPAIGALVGLGVALAWRHRDDLRVRLAAIATILV